VSDALLEVRGLTVHFAGTRRGRPVRAVDGVDLDLPRRGRLALVGESGSGKSTVAETLVGLNRPTAGSIRFDGHDLSGLSQPAWAPFRRRIQIVFQDPLSTLDPHQRIGSILREPLDVHRIGKPRERRMRALALLEAVGLESWHHDRYPHEFSGGQAQRIALASALMVEPELLICDEPLSALDASISAKIVNLLSDLAARFGLALVFITHDLGLARYLCEQVAVMYLGRVVERGPREVVLQTPTHPYTRALLSAAPVPDPRVERHRERIVLHGEIPSPVDPPPGCPFHTRCPERERVPGDRCRTEVPPLHELSLAAGTVRCACHLSAAPARAATPGP
jgi:oligopeptide/dipeptide ABC transporter ATP-binding protein